MSTNADKSKNAAKRKSLAYAQRFAGLAGLAVVNIKSRGGPTHHRLYDLRDVNKSWPLFDTNDAHAIEAFVCGFLIGRDGGFST